MLSAHGCDNKATINGAVFVVLFLAFLAVLLTQRGLTQTDPDTFRCTEYKYLHNAIDLWPATIAFAAGVAAVLWGIGATAFLQGMARRHLVAGAGTILVVIALFCYAGFNSTAYYPSLLDASSSLSIRNSSSTEFTLTVMSWVSVIVPFVAAYIIVAWRKMDSVKVTATDSALLTSDREKTLFNAGAANHQCTPAFYYQREAHFAGVIKSQGSIYNPESNPKGKP